jgi:ribonuclease HII
LDSSEEINLTIGLVQQKPTLPDLSFEGVLWQHDVEFVAGVDEAGRGALAGPVAAAVVILPNLPDLHEKLIGVRDSKQMTPKARQYWADQIRLIAVSFGVGFSSNLEIDQLGILPATKIAIQRGLEKLSSTPQHLLIDFINCSELEIPQTSLVKGDARSLSIAAASILAKTERDDLLLQLDQQYPGYGLAQNKGYGTQAHRNAIALVGKSDIHRKSFLLKFEKDEHDLKEI